MEWLVEWWDGVELWLVQLPYPLLVALVLAVLVPVCWGLARFIDRWIDRVGAKLTRFRTAEPPLSRRDEEGLALPRRPFAHWSFPRRPFSKWPFSRRPFSRRRSAS